MSTARRQRAHTKRLGGGESGRGACWAEGMGGSIPMRESMRLDSHARFVKY
ncbi:hypothetical protein [Hydrogenophaga sp.]|uniref:hypothetical protein n=1 Tax=Hydrogenophaga sp. TaxID=1904254 RepID=UPI002AC9506C|nr:hypothetical protein [Hydrogenophaga sp.]